MKDFDPAASFLGETAAHNDDVPRGDEDETVALLSELARGRALEFAIGSGRIDLPLLAAGVAVDGIELSPTWSPSCAAVRVDREQQLRQRRAGRGRFGHARRLSL